MSGQGSYLGLIDCNNCFVSCECILKPELRDRPVGALTQIFK